jgi:adenylate cyclase class IV
MELEVVLDEHESVDSGEKIAAELMRKLGISEKDLLETAYIDMIK